MIHNPQQLVKELFALKIIGIVVLEFALYSTHYLHWWLYYLKPSLRFECGLHTYNITS